MPGIDEHSHGGNLRALGLESGRDPDAILDFSANLNPLGPPPWLAAAVERGLARVAAYPDPDATSAREAASKRFGLPPSRFLFADGADSLILALPRAVGAARVFAFVPGYSGYLRAVARSGAAFRPVPLDPERDFALDAAALSAALGEGPALRDPATSAPAECGAAAGRDLVFIGSPNNPAGGCLPNDALCALATAFPSVVFAVDESFAELSGRPQGLVGRHPSNVLVLRSLTKTYAMPGIRAGFAEGDEGHLAAIRRELPAWPLSSFAEEACVEALADRAWGEEGAARVAEARASLVAGIAAMPGLRVVPGPANFILVGFRAGRGARRLRGLLLREGFAIRVFSPEEGLDDAWFRLAVRKPEENRRLMDAMRDILCGPLRVGKARGAVSPFVLVGGALLVDILLGDPETSLHPVRLMGRLASAVEGVARRGAGHGAPEPGPRAKAGLVVRGALAWACVVGLSAGAAALLLWLARLAGSALGGALGGGAAAGAAAASAAAANAAASGARGAEGLAAILLVYVSIAPRDLARHALRVRRALRAGGLEEGRQAVSMIVGRDVARLDEAGVVRACVESVAESAVDGVVAPLFWALLLGPIGAVAYRAINTLDSSWGYRDGRYRHFGRVAARADDAANWLPARLGFLAAILAALVLGRDARGAARIGWRDRRKHDSPNAAWLEACFAGALHVRLAGPAWYGGELLGKPFLGDDLRPVEAADIGRSVALMYVTALVFAAAGAGLATLAAGFLPG